LNDKSVSLFIALHVLEHVNDDQKAMREISRVLSTGGLCIIQVPLSDLPNLTEEIPILDEQLRIAKYGQKDHVRLYGEDILERLRANGLLGVFVSADEVMPSFLRKVYSLDDGMKFIICSNDVGPAGRDLIDGLVKKLRNEYKKLETFSELFTSDSL
jgi:SAM-dependent methyltransferase